MHKNCTAAIDYFTAHVTSQWDAPGYYYPLKSSDASFTMGLFHLITSFLYSHSHTLSYLAKKLGILLLMSEMKFFQAFSTGRDASPKQITLPHPVKTAHIVQEGTLGERRYESIASVGESRVWWRADFQSGSRVLKKGF